MLLLEALIRCLKDFPPHALSLHTALGIDGAHKTLPARVVVFLPWVSLFILMGTKRRCLPHVRCWIWRVLAFLLINSSAGSWIRFLTWLGLPDKLPSLWLLPVKLNLYYLPYLISLCLAMVAVPVWTACYVLDWLLELAIVATIVGLQLMFFVWPFALLSSVWAVVYYECFRTALRPTTTSALGYPAATRLAHLVQLTSDQQEAYNVQSTIFARWIRQNFVDSPEAVCDMLGLTCLGPAWLEILYSGTDTWIRSMFFCENQDYQLTIPAPVVGSPEEQLAFTYGVLADLLNKHFPQRYTSSWYCPTYPQLVYQLAGAATLHLPFRRLHRLDCRLSLSRFILLLIPFPILRHLPFLAAMPITHLEFLFNFETTGPPGFEPVKAAVQSVVDKLSGYGRFGPAQIICCYLEQQHLHEAMLAAEEKAYEAILDAVLVWKAKREDKARPLRRLKAE
ncbi:hypothetical protein JCM8097_005937 [Rhodosporidiobolus ruineniae]